MATEQLRKQGYGVVPIRKVQENLEMIRESLIDDILKMPELATSDVNLLEQALVGGGFCALGNASSFHVPTVQWLRRRIYNVFKPFWPDFTDRYVEFIIDRLLVRPPNRFPTRESWHRDLPGKGSCIRDDDIVFGGWLNLDKVPQYFSCVPGSHCTKTVGHGFAKIPKEQYPELNAKKVKVEIPPGKLYILFVLFDLLTYLVLNDRPCNHLLPIHHS